MKKTILVLLLSPVFSFGQNPDGCLFPSFSTDIDSVLVQVWLKAKPGLPADQVARISQKRVKSPHGKAVMDSLWQLTLDWLTDKFGKGLLCGQVAGSFPHFTMSGEGRFGTQFVFYEKPFERRSHFFTFQIYFDKTPGGWKLHAPDYLPDCRLHPDSCQFNIDEKAAKKIAAENGIRGSENYSLSVRGMGHFDPFTYKIVKPRAAGECLDSTWLLDRRTGHLSPPKVECDRHCTTYQEMVEQSPVIVEVQELGEGGSFDAGGEILTSHRYRVLQVFKGDSIPDFIEVVQGGGKLKHTSSNWSHGTVRFLSGRKTGLLFLQEFSRRFVHTKHAGPAYFRYKPYIPYGDQFAYGEMTPIIREERMLDPEHLLFAPIEAHTGKPRQRRQLGEVRDRDLAKKMRKWGFGYRTGQPGLLVELFSNGKDPWVGVWLEAAPVPVYLDSVNIHIRYDTLVFGKRPAETGKISVVDTVPRGDYFFPKFHDVKLADVAPGLLSLQLVSKAADRLDPAFAFQPNGYKLPGTVLRLDLPAERSEAAHLELVDFDEQPGGRYVDFLKNGFEPLGYVAGVTAARVTPTLPLSVDKGPGDTLRYDSKHKQWQAVLFGQGLRDPALEAWAPVQVVGQDGAFIPSYQKLPDWSLYQRPEGGLLFRISYYSVDKDGTAMPLKLRSGIVYLCRPGDWKAGEVLGVGYLHVK